MPGMGGMMSMMWIWVIVGVLLIVFLVFAIISWQKSSGGFVMKRAFAFIGMATFILACQKAPTARQQTTAKEKTYTMNGKLLSRDAAKNEVTIDNEDVPGVMSPMTMAYELRGAKADSLPPDGSKITSTLHEQNGMYWVTNIKPIK